LNQGPVDRYWSRIWYTTQTDASTVTSLTKPVSAMPLQSTSSATVFSIITEQGQGVMGHSAAGMVAVSVQVTSTTDVTETDPPALTKAVPAPFLVLESQGRGLEQVWAARAIAWPAMPQLASDQVLTMLRRRRYRW
jgi:hypothetical protein